MTALTVVPVVTAQQFVRELLEHNDFFDRCVDVIPSKVYLGPAVAAAQTRDEDDDNDNVMVNKKYHKESGQESKHTKRALAKAEKRRRLDPAWAETTVQKKQRLESSGKSTVPVSSISSVLPKPAENETTTEIINRDVETSKNNNMNLSLTTTTTTNTTTDVAAPITAALDSHIGALRERLRAKIAAKQMGRPSCDQISKRAARREQKLQRRRDAVARKEATTPTSTTTESTKATTKSNGKKKKETAVVRLPTLAESVPLSRDLETVDFGRLAGLTSPSNNYLETNKSLANVNRPKNTKQALVVAQAKREKLQALQAAAASGQDDTAVQRVRSIQWADALKEADGQRVKDDPAKLQQTLKRQAAKKSKSQKAWKSRLDQAAAAQQERQQIRNHNLAARKQKGQVGANLSKKKIIAAGESKYGDAGQRQSRAGFEGRKQEFLNSGSKGKK